LASVGKDCAVEHLVRIADILTQLLQTDDLQEFIQVQSSLFTVFKLNPKCKLYYFFFSICNCFKYINLKFVLFYFILQAALNEIFNQINTAVVEEVRKRAIKFLVAKLPAYLEQSGSKDLEDIIIKHVKTVFLTQFL